MVFELLLGCVNGLTSEADMRVSCSIHSANAGSIMTFPREDRLVRLYVQLAEATIGDDDFDIKKVTPEMIMQCAENIIKP